MARVTCVMMVNLLGFEVLNDVTHCYLINIAYRDGGL